MGARTLFYEFFSSIRRRLLAFSLAIVLVLGFVGAYIEANAQWLLQGVWQVYERQDLLSAIGDSAERSLSSLDAYLASKGSESLLALIREAETMEEAVRRASELAVVSHGGTASKRTIEGLVQEFLRETQVAVNAKRGRDEEAYARSWERVQRIASYLETELDHLSLEEFRVSLKEASRFYQKLGYLQATNALMLLTLVSLAIVMSFWFAGRISEPIELLSKAAAEITRGNYTFDLANRGTDEIGRLTGAFEQMRHSIVENIEEIRHAADVENENLRMRSLLRNAEYQALQAQINPHFLFNTLNAAGQLAMMEDSPETEKFLTRLAHLMRHNIRNLDQPVPLMEEIRNLENYLYIMKIRFGERITFDIRIDANIEGVMIPPMTLQPVVENAVLHGLKDRETGGTVAIRLLPPEDGWMAVEVLDNGIGISTEVLQRILADSEGAGDESPEQPSGHSNGIGLGNVIHRLQFFYGHSDVVRITSQPGFGTAVQLRLPISEGSHA